MKKLKIILSILGFLIVCCSLNGCSSGREFGNGIYYSEDDPNVYITVSDVQETSGGEDYYKTCKIQLSDTYDIDSLQSNIEYMLSQLYIFNYSKQLVSLSDDEYNKKMVEVEKLIRENVNLKEQLVDNACEARIYRDEDETFESLFVTIVGSECIAPDNIEDYFQPIEIMIDEDGTLVLGVTEEVFK